MTRLTARAGSLQSAEWKRNAASLTNAAMQQLAEVLGKDEVVVTLCCTCGLPAMELLLLAAMKLLLLG